MRERELAFYFVSFDPGGFVTIDKPPLGFWLQVASVKIFGFTAFALFFPQALAGVLSVLLPYYLVRRHFGVIAGLLAALLLTPAVWSAIPALQDITQDLPIAGASQQGGAGGGGMTLNIDTALIRYLEAHQGSAKYLVAVSSAQQASAIILVTNKPVMALGGFTGSDPILTTSQLAALVANGTVRFFLLNGTGGGGGPGGGSQSSLISWVTQSCATVSYQSSSSGFGGGGSLYDCAAATA